jgi:O-antigen/teichoic acid export membrane protein
MISKKAPWYFISSVLKGFSGFILLPIYTRYLTPEQYGQFQTLRSIAEFLPLIITFSIHAAFTRLYFDYKDKNKEGLSKLYSTIFWFLFVWGIIVYFISVWCSQFFIKEFVHLPLWPFIPLAFLAPLFGQMGLLGDLLLKLNLESKKFSIISFSSFFISSIFNIVILTHTELKIEACLIGYVVINLIPFMYYTYVGFKSGILKFSFDKKILTESLMFSLPFQVAAVASWIVGYSDRLLLTYFGAVAVVGNYAIATTISKILYMFSDSIGQIQGPMSLQDFSTDVASAQQKMMHFLERFISLLIFAFFGLSLFSPELITLLLPKSYNSSILLIPMLAASYVVSGIYRPYQSVLIHFKKNWALSHGMIIQTIFGVAFNLIFIPLWSDKAAALSQLFSTVIFTIYLIYHSQKVSPIKINFVKLLIPFLFAFAISQYLISHQISWELFSVKLILLIILFIYYQTKYHFMNPIFEFIKNR